MNYLQHINIAHSVTVTVWLSWLVRLLCWYNCVCMWARERERDRERERESEGGGRKEGRKGGREGGREGRRCYMHIIIISHWCKVHQFFILHSTVMCQIHHWGLTLLTWRDFTYIVHNYMNLPSLVPSPSLQGQKRRPGKICLAHALDIPKISVK